ncbi:MAG: AAA family ATPase [Syntrophales bacterium]
METINSENITKYVKSLHKKGATFEAAALVNEESGKVAIYSGYFKNTVKSRKKLLRKIKGLNATAIYVSLNPCNAKVAKHRIYGDLGPVTERTRDNEITEIRKILVDVDPVLPSGTSSTDQEHKDAITLASRIYRFLAKKGFPEPLRVDSGNGAHLIFSTKMANTEQNVRLIHDFLVKLARRFNTDTLKIDTSVSNPSRLVKLPGTITRKGKATTDRPHRMARILSVPETLEKVMVKTIKQFDPGKGAAELIPPPASPEPHGYLDVPAYLKHYKIPFTKEKKHRGGTLYELKHCVFNHDHTPGKASIIRASNGMLYYKCFHNSCSNMHWADVRQKISGRDELWRFYKTIPLASVQLEEIVPYTFMWASSLMKQKIKERPLIKGLLEKGGSLLIVGQAGIGKSLMTLNIALNLGSAQEDGRLWGIFDIPKSVKTIIVQSENGIYHLKNRVKRMAKGNQQYEKAFEKISFASIRNDCRVTGDLRDQRFKDMLIDLTIKTGSRLLIIDPFISFHNQNENDNAEIRKVLDSLTEVCDITKSSCILIHHTGKTSADKLFAARGASSIADWASNILLLGQSEVDGEKLIEVNHVKSRNFRRQPPFILKLTSELDFVRASNDEEKRVDIVVKVLKDMGGTVGTQTEFAKAIMKKETISESSAYRMIKKAVKEGKIVKDKEGKEVAYKLA